jgi:ribonucleotide reductase alpha subunit
MALESGFVSVRHEGDFYPIVTRACEDCGTHYEQPWNKREIAYCLPCGLKRASAKGKEGARAAMRQISENTSEQQIRAFNDLKFSLNRRPYKTEWEDHCKAFGIPVRLHPGAIPTYKDLEQRASVANHRVISVEYAGIEDVYNGTVDEFHNYYIGHYKISSDKARFSYVNTKNCGEIPLTVGEPCDLGAINLAAYVEKGSFNFKKFRSDVRDCTRFLDDVLEVNIFALPDNRVASQDLRRLGLGVMGLADALILMGLRYDRQDGRDMIDQIMSTMREEAVRESENLGLERGVYPVFERYQEKIPHAPRRNVAVLTVAPTGTTSMLMGVSSGIEPVFSPFIWRKIGSDYKALIAPLFQELLEQFPAHPQYARDGRWDWDKVTEALGGNHGSCVGLDFVPQVVQDVFVCAHDIAPLDHVRMQGTVQKAFDRESYAANSLSKTINLPNHATVEEIEAAYLEAYKTGCKGITVYRDGSRQFQVLSVSKDEKKEEAPATTKLELPPELTESSDNHTWQASPKFQPGKPILERPTRLTGVTDMVKLTDLGAGSKRTFLITTNTLEGKPMEVVVVSGRAGDEANADSEALGRVVSIALQYGVPAEAIQKTLRGINGGLYGSYNGRLVASKADLIAVALESTSSTGGFKPAEQPLLYPTLEGAAPENSSDTPLFKLSQAVEMKGEKCPSCSSPNLVREEGCLKCQSCGYSKCG